MSSRELLHKNDNKSINCINRILILVLLFLTVPILAGCLYAVPSADDFSNAIGWMEWDGNHFIYVLRNTQEIYCTWQGTYFGNLLVSFPLYSVAGILGLRLVLLSVTSLFLISMLLLLRCLLVFFGFQNQWVAICSNVLFIISLGYIWQTSEGTELFYWYTGACVYTIPIACSLLCVLFYVLYDKEEKRRYLIIAILLSLIAVGGSLNIAAMTCSLLMLLATYQVLVLRKTGKRIIILLFAIIGSFINVLAPGNYVRHAAIDSRLGIKTVILYTLERMSNIIAEKYQDGWLFVLMLVAFLITYFFVCRNEFCFKYPLFVTVWCVVAISITDFPVVLGYGSNVFPPRCTFVESLITVFAMVIISIYWGGWCANKRLFEITHTSLFILALLCVVMFEKNLQWERLMSFTPVAMSYHIVNADFQNITNKEMDILNQISNSKSENVVVCVYKDSDEEWSNIKRIGLTEDSDWWVNCAIASYYSKKTIAVEYVE